MSTTPVSPTIRPAQPDDLPRMQQIAVHAWQPIYQGFRERMGEDLFSRVYAEPWADCKAREIADHFQQRPEWCLVAELAGQVVGFLTFVLDADSGVAEIGNNAVDPDWQGQGVGSALYHHVLALFRETGMVWAKVHTGLDEAHQPARTAYQRIGFELMMPHGEYYRKL